MISFLAQALLALTPLLLGALLVRLARDRAGWEPFALGVFVTGVGLTAAVATYLWVFEDAECGGMTHLGCRLNKNEGVLAVLGIVLAVVALWTTALTREFDR